MSNSILYHGRQSKTQKRDAALRAASLFWVLCSDKTSDSYNNSSDSFRKEDKKSYSSDKVQVINQNTK